MATPRTRHARNLRQSSGVAENRIWSLLRAGRIDGHKVRRQHPISRYVADFACDHLRLVVEIDGVAMQFFHELTLPENQLVAMARIPYSGASTNLDKMLPADKASLFPTTAGNAELQFVNDLEQWKQIAPKVEKRWQQFKLGM